jgi:hypothetical protein
MVTPRILYEYEYSKLPSDKPLSDENEGTRLHLVRKVLNLWGTEKSKNVNFSLKYTYVRGIFGKIGVGTFLTRCNLVPSFSSDNGLSLGSFEYSYSYRILGVTIKIRPPYF